MGARPGLYIGARENFLKKLHKKNAIFSHKVKGNDPLHL